MVKMFHEISRNHFITFSYLPKVIILMAVIGCGGQQIEKPPIKPPQPPPPRPTNTQLNRWDQGIRKMKPVVIVIDPGHGGNKPGTMIGSLPGKTLNLMIAKSLAEELTSYGANVILTRDNDRDIDLVERAEISNQNRADFFISIHNDSNPNSAINGATIYLEPNAQRKTENIALSIKKAFQNAGIECLGVRRKELIVLINNKRPAILVECGFLSNPTEAAKLNQASYRHKLARTIAHGIAEYFINSQY